VPLLGKDIEVMDDVALCTVVKHTTIFAAHPAAEVAGGEGAAGQRPHRRFPRRRHQRCAGSAGCGRGISVDSGADIAKETADIILLEKSLMVLEEG
jgi:Mg2+-importing ATPase